MTPVVYTSEDMGESRWVAFVRNKLARYIVPAILTLWLLLLAAAAFVAPDMVMKLNMMALGLAVGMAILMFPGTFLVLVVFSLLLNPENFLFTSKWAAEHFPTMEIQSLHKFVVLGAFIPPIVRYGIRPVMNYGIAAIFLMAALTFVASTPYPGLTPMQTVKSLVGLALPFALFNMKLQRKWIDGHLAFIAVFPLISLFLGLMGEIFGLRNVIGYPWHVVSLEFTGAQRLAGINIPAYLAFYCYISFFVCLYEAIALKRRGFYVLGGITLLILVFTGTRTPSVCAILMAGIGIFFSSGRDLRGSSKFVVSVLGITFLAGILALYWPELQTRMTGHDSDPNAIVNTSGRAGMWAYLMGIYEVNQIFGRGLGTGAIALLDVDDPSFGTAAHNEYIRLLVDGGIVGLISYITGLVALLIQEGRFLNRTQGVFITALFVSFALYSFTDNTISSPPAVVLFYAVALVMAKARYERSANRRA